MNELTTIKAFSGIAAKIRGKDGHLIVLVAADMQALEAVVTPYLEGGKFNPSLCAKTVLISSLHLT